MQFRLISSLFLVALASANEQKPEQAVKQTPEQLRKNLKGKRGLQSSDGGDNGGDDGSGGGCFSKMNSVEVQGKGIISMDSVQIGDYVRSNDNDFSRVFSFGHLDNEVEFDFLQIFSEGSKQPLELTFNHMIFANNKAVRAEAVKTGDMLGDKKVTDIKNVKRNGVFAPITESGEIMVSGVRASSYVAMMDHVPVNQHYMIHMFFAPHRALCSLNFSWCEKETYTEEGFSTYSGWAIKMYMAANKFSAPIQYLLAAVGVLTLPTWYTAEQFLVAPFLSLAMLGYVVYKSKTKQVKLA